MCTCVLCFVLFVLCFLYNFVYVYLFLFVLSVLVQGLLPQSDNSIAISNNNEINNTYILRAAVRCLQSNQVTTRCWVNLLSIFQ